MTCVCGPCSGTLQTHTSTNLCSSHV